MVGVLSHTGRDYSPGVAKKWLVEMGNQAFCEYVYQFEGLNIQWKIFLVRS